MNSLRPSSRFLRELDAAERIGFPFKWGNIANLNPATVEEIGIRRAILEARAEEEEEANNRNASREIASLMKGEPNRKKRNAIRKAHYTRKGLREAAREKTRRNAWVRQYQMRGARESNWELREKAHWLKRHPGKTVVDWEAHAAKVATRKVKRSDSS